MPFDERQAVNALTVLTRLAQREQDVGEWIHRALLADPAGLLGPAIQVGVETGHPMPRVVDVLLGEVDLPTEVLVAARARIPPYTSALQSTAALITGMLLERGAVAGTPEGVGLAAEHAERLLETGDLDRAVRMAREALALARPLAADHPHVLLHAARVLSACLSVAGDHDEAIHLAEQSVGLLTQLRLDGLAAGAAAWYALGERLLRAGLSDRALAAFDRAAVAYGALTGAPAAAVPPGRTVPAVPPEEVGELYYGLALALLGRAQVLDDLKRPAEALPAAVRALGMLRERAAQAPDAYGLAHAKAVLATARCLASAVRGDPDGAAAAAPLVLPYLMAAALQVLEDAGVRRRLDEVRSGAAYLAGLVKSMSGEDPDPFVAAVDAQVDLGLAWLADDRPAEAALAAAAAVESAQALIERFGEVGRLPLQRALMARSRIRERAADVEAALADAAEAVQTAAHDLDRVVAAHTQSIRLGRAGRGAEAFAAERDAVEHLIPLYRPDQTDQVFAAVHMTGRLFVLAEEGDRLAELGDDVLRFGVSVLTSFPGHRAEARILDSLAFIGFGAIRAYGARDDPANVAAAHRALTALTTRYPAAEVLRDARVMAAFNAIRCHLRNGRLDLATAAYEDVAALAEADGGTDEAILVEQAKCANVLLNVLVDVDFARAAELVRAAGPALRSPAYLAVLPRMGEDDPPGYLEWLDQIASGQGVVVDQDTDPAVLATLDADHRATLAERLRTMGEDHPATLAVRINLAEILRLRGLRGEAVAELTAALESYRRVHGADHPDTRAVEERLAGL
ncbi:tetratricopeptide repeat protein [Phytohabitans sp. ZYX-F-186]|uniref:Tetratricopeptide repeat protein n=1 Tax=Phytohabitans maris TaxID=3071409 RepID=A0ABU0ZM19_9ACTN|nr:tetratricopeptide repeat protein [Phytohabitans sp. ZYX-F-186]MDQ7908089.1 tetratricopeptide repeat protein [Phytohabitans sp. ZYX-F-186]